MDYTLSFPLFKMKYDLNIFTRHCGFEDTPTRNFINLLYYISDLMKCDADDYAERVTQRLESNIEHFYEKLHQRYLDQLEAAFPEVENLLSWPRCLNYHEQFEEFYDLVGYRIFDVREELITIANTKRMKEELIATAMCPDRIDSIFNRFGKQGVIDTFE